jgi:deoxyribodipyrimidine photo-lyase
MTAIVWLRRDLRLHDHPALLAALNRGEDVIPAFVLDDRLLAGPHASGPRTQFMLECLQDLGRSLRERGSGLVIRRGAPEQVLTDIASQCAAATVHVSADVSPYARRRDQRVRLALKQIGVGFLEHPGVFAIEDLEAIRTHAGGPYTVFTPFYRAWLSSERRSPVSCPGSLPALPSSLRLGNLPTLDELDMSRELDDPAPGGEHAARATADEFLAGPVDRYGEGRNLLAGDGTSRLSPYLHFGCISARELESRLGWDSGAAAFRRQLCWRDFYGQVLLHFPANVRSEYQERYRGKLDWSRDEPRFEAWCDGRTGFPLVDAGMRQLRREGWMHNRARLVVGSFLTKDLGIDWRLGERWFMRLLLDGDEASNNGNWQWIASVGVDPQPPFRRILSPTRQQQRFDPDGTYVRRYVPELAGVPNEHLAEPWEMSAEAQERSGCAIGRDYPQPIVDHAAARREALDRYRT